MAPATQSAKQIPLLHTSASKASKSSASNLMQYGSSSSLYRASDGHAKTPGQQVRQVNSSSQLARPLIKDLNGRQLTFEEIRLSHLQKDKHLSRHIRVPPIDGWKAVHESR